MGLPEHLTQNSNIRISPHWDPKTASGLNALRSFKGKGNESQRQKLKVGVSPPCVEARNSACWRIQMSCVLCLCCIKYVWTNSSG